MNDYLLRSPNSNKLIKQGSVKRVKDQELNCSSSITDIKKKLTSKSSLKKKQLAFPDVIKELRKTQVAENGYVLMNGLEETIM